MYLSKHIFRSQQLQKYLTYDAHTGFKTLEISCKYQKCTKRKCSKKSMVFYIIVFELVTGNFLSHYENTGSLHLWYYQVALKSQIWLKITYSNAIWLRMIKVVQRYFFLRFQDFFGLVKTVTAKGFSEERPVMHINKHMLLSQ